MMMQTSELEGAALDWAVLHAKDPSVASLFIATRKPCPPASTDWAQSGPMIDEEKICLLHVANRLPHQRWDAGEEDEFEGRVFSVVSGPTPLVAAMRCFAINKLGKEVDVPDELVESTKTENQIPRERG